MISKWPFKQAACKAVVPQAPLACKSPGCCSTICLGSAAQVEQMDCRGGTNATASSYTPAHTVGRVLSSCDLIGHVIQFLSPKDCASVARVNRTWKAVADRWVVMVVMHCDGKGDIGTWEDLDFIQSEVAIADDA